MKTVRMKLIALKLEYDVYPRVNIDRQHTDYIVQAIEGGSEMPPLVVCKKTKRIVDGFHRYKAYQRLEVDEVDVVEKSYRNDRELFLDAIRYNSQHGRSLTPFDRAHCTILATNYGIADEDLCGVLHVKVQFVEELRKDRTSRGNGTPIPIKNIVKHMKGRKLTKRQKATMPKLGGNNQAYYPTQLILLIESGMLDFEDERLMQQLSHLRDLLNGIDLPRVAVA